MIGAVVATGLTVGNRRPRTGAIASFDQQHKRGAKVDEPRQLLQPKTAAVEPPTTPRPTAVSNSIGLEHKFDSSSFVVPPKPTTTVARSSSIPRIVEMTIGAEQSSGTSPLLRSDRTPYSSATANGGERDREGGRDRERERSQEQDAGRPQRGESVATSQTPERAIDGRPREERLVKARQFKGDLRNLPRTRPPQR